MSELLELNHRLQDTSSAITKLELALAKHPDSPVLRLNLESVWKRFDQLQAELDEFADRHSLDVCSYRLFRETDESPSLRGYSGALYEFQAAFSAVFDAIQNGPRRRTRLSPDVAESTRFSFGYAYAGSLGVVLTLERERLLIDIGPLTDTITTFFNIARAPTRDDIREIGRRLGPAPLRAIFKWADAHADDGNGADISWRHGENTEHLLLQRAEIIRLRDEIDATSEEERVPFTFTGVLTGASIVSKNFDFKPDGSDPIKGRFVDVINENHKVKLPGARYVANVEKVTKVRYSSEEESTTWHLVDLNEIT